MISTVYIYIRNRDLQPSRKVLHFSHKGLFSQGHLIEISFQVLIIYCYLLVDHCNTTMLLKISAVIEFAIECIENENSFFMFVLICGGLNKFFRYYNAMASQWMYIYIILLKRRFGLFLNKKPMKYLDFLWLYKKCLLWMLFFCR